MAGRPPAPRVAEHCSPLPETRSEGGGPMNREPKWRLLQGDARHRLREIPGESVQVVVTSPPYWGLRDYPVPDTVWGGDPECQHEWGPLERGKRKDILPADQS